ncbi:Ig-like domain-containing protein [Sabulilitoribacter arenilitoris]|uniref:Ig-like domain-containing protein n=1 Tax=Wocania arenilitoris TaxID=2044858 RepID=A0AAE3EQL7_9FLAO|nr:Ig-like domain-containing domain [Wocania arenilitoris]MCF7568409.1 Ig-like domain-containing protein [Wocania arenilitoris]
MNKSLSNFIFVAFICLVFTKCANRGTPQGGPKDVTPPVIEKSTPENFTTNFKGNEIRIVFDEYIKIKDIQKQLIISPPMKYQPDITPLGNASEEIRIKINDTLPPNTTYAFNFGNSITDNNEGNPFPYFRYVFSTGDYIDSLTVNGQIIDAFKREPETFVTVALYEVDSTYTDSIIYKEVPKYVTNTLDSLTTFSIENIKAGKYLLMALKDGNGDNKFQQKTDQIAFHKEFIDVPSDSTFYTLKLFNEELDFKPVKPRLISGEKIAFGYEGDYKNMDIKITSETPDDFTYRITKDEKTDTLYYWYKPRLKVDSLLFKVTHPTIEKDYKARISEQKRDSLIIKAEPTGKINDQEAFNIFANTPLTAFDASKMKILDKDSTNVEFTTVYDSIKNIYSFDFKRTEDNSYKVQVLPEAFIDFFDNKNDTLNYALSTKKESDIGNLRVIVNNATYPIIVQLTNNNEEVKYEKISTKKEALDFLKIDPGKYFLRVIFDSNGNGRYDTGNFLKKIQPERVSYLPSKPDDEIRAGWDDVWIIDLLD